MQGMVFFRYTDNNQLSYNIDIIPVISLTATMSMMVGIVYMLPKQYYHHKDVSPQTFLMILLYLE